MKLDPAVSKLEVGVERGKQALAKAEIVAEKYQIRKEHWDKLERLESGVQKTLAVMDRISKEKMQRKRLELERRFALLTAFGAIFLIGSTAALWWFTREKPPRQPREPEEVFEETGDNDEYEYVYVDE